MYYISYCNMLYECYVCKLHKRLLYKVKELTPH